MNPNTSGTPSGISLSVIGTKGDVIVEPAAHLADVRFFPNAELNIAENILRPNDDPSDLLLVGCGEGGVTERLTRGEMLSRVGQMQQLLRRHQVGVGDVVAAWLPEHGRGLHRHARSGRPRRHICFDLA